MATPRKTAKTSASATKPTAAPKPQRHPKAVTATASGAPKASPDHVAAYTVTIPLDHIVSATVDATVAVAKVPVTAARRVASAGNGLPIYMGLGALAVAGIAEWPVVATAGVGLAAMRHWGPLRPAPDAAQEKAPRKGSSE